MSNITEIFGSLVFNDTVMKEKLPKDTYKKLRKTIDNGEALSIDTANVVANALPPLVPADDGGHRRTTRQLYYADG